MNMPLNHTLKPAALPTIPMGRQRVTGEMLFQYSGSLPVGNYAEQNTKRGDIVHFSTDDLTKTPHIRHALIALIQAAKQKVLFCSFLFADDDIVQALCEAAERLQGGVYILTALGKHLRAEVLELDGEVDAQTAKLQERATRHDEHLRRLARAGAWLRSAEDCHAKFCVIDDLFVMVTSANATKEAYEINPEDGLALNRPAAAREFGRLFAHIWQHLTTLESLPGANLDVHSLAASARVPWHKLACTDVCRCVTTLRRYENSLLDAAVNVIDQAQTSLVIATYSFMGMEEHPAGAALQRALIRGVTIELLVQPRNHIDAQRHSLAWLVDCAPHQVRVYGHRRTHTKSIVADETTVLLWTGNLDARHGWHDGIEVGVVVEDSGVAAAVSRWVRDVAQRATHVTVNAPSIRELAEATRLPTALSGHWELLLPEKTVTEPLINSLTRYPVELIEASGQPMLRTADGVIMPIKIDNANHRLVVQRVQGSLGHGIAQSKGWLVDSDLTLSVPSLPSQHLVHTSEGSQP